MTGFNERYEGIDNSFDEEEAERIGGQLFLEWLRRASIRPRLTKSKKTLTCFCDHFGP
jgi:hypothetical protein